MKKRWLMNDKYLNMQKVAFLILKSFMIRRWFLLVREKHICVFKEGNIEIISFWQKSLLGVWCGLRLIYKKDILDKAYLIAGDEEEEVFTNLKTMEVCIDEEYLQCKKESNKMERRSDFFENLEI